MKGFKITFMDNGDNYAIKSEPLNPFDEVNPKWIMALYDFLNGEKGKVVGEITKDFYDKDYFEGKSEKSGLVGFDDMSKSYAEEHAKERVLKLIKIVLGDDDYGRMQKDYKYLEIGCAFGHTVDKLRDMGYEAYGIDISEYAINKYKKDYKFVGDIRYDILQYMPFDLIYGFNLMEHIAEIDLRETLRNFYAQLSQGGLLFLTIDPIYGQDLSHVTIRPREWWDNLFLFHGFDIHKEGTEMFKGINGHVYTKI